MGLLDSAKAKASSAASSKVSGVKQYANTATEQATAFKTKYDSGKAFASNMMGKVQSASGKLKGLANNVSGVAGGDLLGTVAGPGGAYTGGSSKKRTEYPDSEQVSNEGFVRLENYLFVVEINGIEGARFEECSGLEITNSIIELNEGGNNTGSLKFYDRTHYSNIVLRRGLTNDTQLYDWIKNFVEDPSTQEKLDASIVVMTLDSLEVCRINLFGVIPVKWSIPKLRANTGYPIEYIELAVEDAKIDDGSGS